MPGARSPWFNHKTWKLLRWLMTEADAAKWGESNGCDMQQVDGSGEQLSGKYSGFDGPSAPMASIPDKRNS